MEKATLVEGIIIFNGDRPGISIFGVIGDKRIVGWTY